uniref:Uncharacterized protein n=1 Tax=Solanum tuberosum TaxID=4113 RepID=M1DWN3_SOLTU
MGVREEPFETGVVGAEEVRMASNIPSRRFGESSKTPIIIVVSPFDSRHSLSLEFVKIDEFRKVSAIHSSDR